MTRELMPVAAVKEVPDPFGTIPVNVRRFGARFMRPAAAFFALVLRANRGVLEKVAGAFHDGNLASLESRQLYGTRMYQTSSLIDPRLFDAALYPDVAAQLVPFLARIDYVLGREIEETGFFLGIMGHAGERCDPVSDTRAKLKIIHLDVAQRYIAAWLTREETQAEILRFYHLAKGVPMDEPLSSEVIHHVSRAMLELDERRAMIRDLQHWPELKLVLKDSEGMAVMVNPFHRSWRVLMEGCSRFGVEADKRREWLVSLQDGVVELAGLLLDEKLFEAVDQDIGMYWKTREPYTKRNDFRKRIGAHPGIEEEKTAVCLRILLRYAEAALNLSHNEWSNRIQVSHTYDWLAERGDTVSAVWCIVQRVALELRLTGHPRLSGVLLLGHEAFEKQKRGLHGQGTLSDMIRTLPADAMYRGTDMSQPPFKADPAWPWDGKTGADVVPVFIGIKDRNFKGYAKVKGEDYFKAGARAALNIVRQDMPERLMEMEEIARDVEARAGPEEARTFHGANGFNPRNWNPVILINTLSHQPFDAIVFHELLAILLRDHARVSTLTEQYMADAPRREARTDAQLFQDYAELVLKKLVNFAVLLSLLMKERADAAQPAPSETTPARKAIDAALQELKTLFQVEYAFGRFKDLESRECAQKVADGLDKAAILIDQGNLPAGEWVIQSLISPMDAHCFRLLSDLFKKRHAASRRVAQLLRGFRAPRSRYTTQPGGKTPMKQAGYDVVDSAWDLVRTHVNVVVTEADGQARMRRAQTRLLACRDDLKTRLKGREQTFANVYNDSEYAAVLKELADIEDSLTPNGGTPNSKEKRFAAIYIDGARRILEVSQRHAATARIFGDKALPYLKAREQDAIFILDHTVGIPEDALRRKLGLSQEGIWPKFERDMELLRGRNQLLARFLQNIAVSLSGHQLLDAGDELCQLQQWPGCLQGITREADWQGLEKAVTALGEHIQEHRVKEALLMVNALVAKTQRQAVLYGSSDTGRLIPGLIERFVSLFVVRSLEQDAPVDPWDVLDQLFQQKIPCDLFERPIFRARMVQLVLLSPHVEGQDGTKELTPVFKALDLMMNKYYAARKRTDRAALSVWADEAIKTFNLTGDDATHVRRAAAYRFGAIPRNTGCSGFVERKMLPFLTAVMLTACFLVSSCMSVGSYPQARSSQWVGCTFFLARPQGDFYAFPESKTRVRIDTVFGDKKFVILSSTIETGAGRRGDYFKARTIHELSHVRYELSRRHSTAGAASVSAGTSSFAAGAQYPLVMLDKKTLRADQLFSTDELAFVRSLLLFSDAELRTVDLMASERLQGLLEEEQNNAPGEGDIKQYGASENERLAYIAMCRFWDWKGYSFDDLVWEYEREAGGRALSREFHDVLWAAWYAAVVHHRGRDNAPIFPLPATPVPVSVARAPRAPKNTGGAGMFTPMLMMLGAAILWRVLGPHATAAPVMLAMVLGGISSGTPEKKKEDPKRILPTEDEGNALALAWHSEVDSLSDLRKRVWAHLPRV
ncbi:MAG: hypothetical protein HQL19_07895, partial [Candidatus Omnitrophica bacterium]|nr:hypothetical protein [Candidatus Omnitrophota bacterium]